MVHDACPVCLLYRHLAEATGLLEDGAAYADQMGALPPGLGGTIAQARGEVDQALKLIGQVARMVPGQNAGRLGQGLVALRGTLAGWLDPGTWGISAAQARHCRAWAYAIAAAHFARDR